MCFLKTHFKSFLFPPYFSLATMPVIPLLWDLLRIIWKIRDPLFSPLIVHPPRTWFNEMTFLNREAIFSVKDALVVLLLQTHKWVVSGLYPRYLLDTKTSVYSCLPYPFRSLCLFLLQEAIALRSSIYTNQVHTVRFTFLVLHVRVLFSPSRNSRAGFILSFTNKSF